VDYQNECPVYKKKYAGSQTTHLTGCVFKGYMDSKSAENTHNMMENTNTLHNFRTEFRETTIPSIFQSTLSHILSICIASFKTHKHFFQ
jgi:hypothetical protein